MMHGQKTIKLDNVCINVTSIRVLETILAVGKQQALNITCVCVCVCVCVSL
jgi:hypothetical protein